MSVHYKFHSSKNFDTVTFEGSYISLIELKRAIITQKKLGKGTDFDLQLTNAQTGDEYRDAAALVPKNTAVIVRRVPATGGPAIIVRGGIAPANAPSTNNASGFKSSSIAMSNFPGQSRQLGRMTTDPSRIPPPNYVCHRCNQPGHYINFCPTNGDPRYDFHKVKKATGIPRSFLKRIDTTGQAGGETRVMTGGGLAVVQTNDSAFATLTNRVAKASGTTSTSPASSIPIELQCPLCKGLLTDVVLIPCCGNSFCENCIKDALTKSGFVCPIETCKETGISLDKLFPNQQLRKAVSNYRKNAGIPEPTKTAKKEVKKQIKQATNGHTSKRTTKVEREDTPHSTTTNSRANPSKDSSQLNAFHSDHVKQEPRSPSVSPHASPSRDSHDYSRVKDHKHRRKQSSNRRSKSTSLSPKRKDKKDKKESRSRSSKSRKEHRGRSHSHSPNRKKSRKQKHESRSKKRSKEQSREDRKAKEHRSREKSHRNHEEHRSHRSKESRRHKAEYRSKYTDEDESRSKRKSSKRNGRYDDKRDGMKRKRHEEDDSKGTRATSPRKRLREVKERAREEPNVRSRKHKREEDNIESRKKIKHKENDTSNRLQHKRMETDETDNRKHNWEDDSSKRNSSPDLDSLPSDSRSALRSSGGRAVQYGSKKSAVPGIKYSMRDIDEDEENDENDREYDFKRGGSRSSPKEDYKLRGDSERRPKRTQRKDNDRSRKVKQRSKESNWKRDDSGGTAREKRPTFTTYESQKRRIKGILNSAGKTERAKKELRKSGESNSEESTSSDSSRKADLRQSRKISTGTSDDFKIVVQV